MKNLKKHMEMETLKALTYDQINEVLVNLHDENVKLKIELDTSKEHELYVKERIKSLDRYRVTGTYHEIEKHKEGFFVNREDLMEAIDIAINSTRDSLLLEKMNNDKSTKGSE